MTVDVTWHRSIPEPQMWDAVVRAAGAPVFYRSSLLTAYERQPLQPTLDTRYLVVQRNGAVAAVLPLYLVPARDPFFCHAHAAASRQTWAISHFWHCYDTRLPAYQITPGLVHTVWQAVHEQAVDWGAVRFGLINIGRETPLEIGLRGTGGQCVPRAQRFRIPLRGATCLGDHLARLPASVRQDTRRQLRRAAALQMTTHTRRPPFSTELVARVCELLGLTAVRYNPGYYEAGPLSNFLNQAGPAVRLLTLESAGRVEAVSVSLLDDGVLHNWAIGVEPELRRRFSPYAALLKPSFELAAAHGCTAIELGRTNPQWKQRVGAEPVDLVAWMDEAAPPDRWTSDRARLTSSAAGYGGADR